MTKLPNSRRNLDIAIERIAGRGQDYVAARTFTADAIVAQLLPNGAVKGGSALKLRYGDNETRFSRDLDAARSSSIDEFIKQLNESLQKGWNGFTGLTVRREPANPMDVPTGYVMQPYDVKLSYLGKSWVTVPLEVGHNEIGDADDPDMLEPIDANRLLTAIGFPPLDSVPVMKLTHQIAQKLHAVTEPGSQRAHDLVDLQLIMKRSEIDLAETAEICKRLFNYRGKQPWPSQVTVESLWSDLYINAASELEVFQTLDEAVTWANQVISRIYDANQ